MSLALLELPSLAKAEVPDRWCPHPWCGPAYFWGAEMRFSRMNGRRNWKPEWPKINFAPNVYIGLQFHRFFGLSLGFERSLKSTVHVTHAHPFFGNDLTGLSYHRSLILQIWHANLEYYLPICGPLDVLASIGVGALRPIVRYSAVTNTNGTFTPLELAMATTPLNRPIVVRARLGLQFQLSESFFLRGLLGYDNIARLHVGGDDQYPFIINRVPVRPLSDLFSGTIGFVVKYGI